jgi:hypothetical protein
LVEAGSTDVGQHLAHFGGAGADVAANDFARDSLGAQVVSDEQASVLRQEHLASLDEDFSSQPLLARLLPFAERGMVAGSAKVQTET